MPPASYMTNRHVWECLDKQGSEPSLEAAFEAALAVRNAAWDAIFEERIPSIHESFATLQLRLKRLGMPDISQGYVCFGYLDVYRKPSIPQLYKMHRECPEGTAQSDLMFQLRACGFTEFKFFPLQGVPQEGPLDWKSLLAVVQKGSYIRPTVTRGHVIEIEESGNGGARTVTWMRGTADFVPLTLDPLELRKVTTRKKVV